MLRGWRNRWLPQCGINETSARHVDMDYLGLPRLRVEDGAVWLFAGALRPVAITVRRKHEP
jgi:hypothetical protein